MYFVNPPRHREGSPVLPRYTRCLRGQPPHLLRRRLRPFGRLLRWDEGRHPVFRCDPNPDTRFPARVISRARLRVDRVQHVVRIDEQAADPAELLVRADEVPVLVKDLDAVVATVGDEQASLGVKCQRVGYRRRREWCCFLVVLADFRRDKHCLDTRPRRPHHCVKVLVVTICVALWFAGYVALNWIPMLLFIAALVGVAGTLRMLRILGR